MKPIYVYIHICILNDWLEVLTNLITNIKTSGLYNVVDKIRCFVLGNLDNTPEILIDKKIEIVKTNPNRKLYERFTLNNLYKDCLKEDFYVLYIHTKGINIDNKFTAKPKSSRQPVRDWVEYLIHFNMYRYKDMLKLLETNDCAGVQLKERGMKRNDGNTHYSGNFWWSKSSHIKTLKPTTSSNYLSPEFWIASKKHNCTYASLYKDRTVGYKNIFPKEKYISEKNNIYFISFS